MHIGRGSIAVVLALIYLAMPIGQALAEGPRTEILKRHARFPGCAPHPELSVPEDQVQLVADLGAGRRLFVVSCEEFAYNLSSAIYVVSGDKFMEAERVLFAEFSPERQWHGADRLFNPSFDPLKKQIVSHTKGRGPGDCGASGAWRWTAAGFKLVLYRAKAKCDGKMGPWPVIFRAR